MVSPANPPLLEGLRATLALAASSRRLVGVRQFALQLLAAHGLSGWRFAFNRRKQTLGLCVYQRCRIELSVHLVQRKGADEILDTLLHEVAHALVGPGHGHDPVWQRKCLEVGARPQRCGQADMPPSAWQARCGGCGQPFDRHRKPQPLTGWFCRGCGPERGPLVWHPG